ncbi:MAG: S49 family peptidase, partial [Solirubrobacteraceae bacterium]|nr:S49 family peptidase [Solirubrobacteraceae bacterium]
VGLRPLAFDPGQAFGLGPRLTLTADLVMREGGEAGASRVRIGGECELLPGLSLRGSADDHGDWRAGIALLGPRVTAHALADRREAGSPHAAAYGVQVHSADERTVLQTPGSRRVATLAVSGNLGDESLGGFSLLGGDATVSSAPLHAALEHALEEPRVRGVLLELGGATGMAQLEELRPRLARLRAAGKPVVAWLPWGAGRGDLYLAGACDRIVASPEGQFMQLGLRVEQRYYRRMLADLGLRLNRTSAGRYKSAGRNLTVDSTTAEDREAIERNLDVIQELFVSTFAADRRIARDSLLGVLDGRDWPAGELTARRVLDAVGEREDALAALGGLAGLGAEPSTVAATRLEVARRAWHVPARVAVVYASGGIELGRSGNDPLWGPTLGAATLVGQLESAFRDPGVRAVVLRIESPGGSALASDAMHRATVRLKRETGKPLVVSMGRTAASGGYHLAIDADRILADRFTRTGSIGVVFASPSLEGFYARRGVRQDVFQRGEWMGAFSPGKDWDPAFQASADSAIGRSYRSFVRKVAAGRKLSFEQADAVAQGRVWMGEDALARGLVDGIGGLEDAVAEARRRGGVPAGERIRLAEYRRPSGGFVERLIASSLRASWERHVGSLSLEEGPMYLAEPIDVE